MKTVSQKGSAGNYSSTVSAVSDVNGSYYRSKKGPGKKTLIIGFIAIILALALFSVLTIIDENDKKPSTDNTEIDPAILNQSEQHISTRLVFAFTDTEKTKVLSIMTADFDSKEKKLVYSFVSPYSVSGYNGTSATLSDHFALGGTKQLIPAISAFTGVSYDRYIVADDNSFGQLLQSLGDTEADIESRISYDHNGVNFIIEEGHQILTPDNMLKYYRYLINDDSTNGEKIAGIIINCFERLVSDEDGSGFESAIGFFETDISAQDYSNNKELLRSLPAMNLAGRATRG